MTSLPIKYNDKLIIFLKFLSGALSNLVGAFRSNRSEKVKLE